jgi:hypothetical protein
MAVPLVDRTPLPVGEFARQRAIEAERGDRRVVERGTVDLAHEGRRIDSRQIRRAERQRAVERELDHRHVERPVPALAGGLRAPDHAGRVGHSASARSRSACRSRSNCSIAIAGRRQPTRNLSRA